MQVRKTVLAFITWTKDLGTENSASRQKLTGHWRERREVMWNSLSPLPVLHVFGARRRRWGPWWGSTAGLTWHGQTGEWVSCAIRGTHWKSMRYQRRAQTSEVGGIKHDGTWSVWSGTEKSGRGAAV